MCGGVDGVSVGGCGVGVSGVDENYQRSPFFQKYLNNNLQNP